MWVCTHVCVCVCAPNLCRMCEPAVAVHALLTVCTCTAAPVPQVYYLYRRPVYAQSTAPTWVGAMRLLRLICLRERVSLIHAHQAFSTLGGEAALQARAMGYKVRVCARACMYACALMLLIRSLSGLRALKRER